MEGNFNSLERYNFWNGNVPNSGIWQKFCDRLKFLYQFQKVIKPCHLKVKL